MLEDMLLSRTITQEFYNWLIDNGFTTAPASTKYHGACEGGLYKHSCAVAEALTNLTEKLDLTWQRKESPLIVGMFHDLCKIDAYTEIESGSYMHNDNMLLKGHGDKRLAAVRHGNQEISKRFMDSHSGYAGEQIISLTTGGNTNGN